MKIVTDSAADLPPEEIRSLDITVAPLIINFPEGEVKSSEITPDEFYTRLLAMEPEIPTTSQPSSGAFAELYRTLAPGGEEILSVHISSGLSGTIEAAKLGAKDVKEARVTHFDTMTLSGGERFHVLAAAHMARSGASLEAILERLKQIREKTEVAYTLDTLKFLARGGRIGRVQALAGALLHLKPIISVDKKDGKYNQAGRARTLKKAIDAVVDYHVQAFGRTPVWVTILHGQFAEQAEALTQLMNQRLQVAKLEVMRISPVLGVHTGPGVVGAAVIPMALMEGME